MGLFGKKGGDSPARPCPHCAREIAGNAIVCPHCGRDVKSGDQVLPATSAAAPIDAVPERHAVAFIPQIRGGSDEAKQCAQQLNGLIDSMAGQGWRFSHLEDITTLRNNGCLASFTGNPFSVVTYQVAIFERLR